MKITLVALNFYLILNCLSGLQTFNPRSSQHANNASNIYYSASHLHGLALQQHNHIATNKPNGTTHLHPSHLRDNPYQRKPHSHDIAIAHRQNDAINDKTNKISHPFRSRIQKGRHQSKQRPTVPQRQVTPVDNRAIHPRFRPLFKSSVSRKTAAGSDSKNPSILKNKIQPNRSLPADNTFSANPTDNNPQTRRRISFADYYYQKHIKPYLEHQHEKVSVETRSNVKTGLKR